MVLGLWLTLESSKLYFCEDMSIKMVKNVLGAQVILKCQLRSAAMRCCLWLVFQVELIVVQRRAGQGQRQATHNKHIPGRFTCYASQEACFTQAARLCGRMGCIFLLCAYTTKKVVLSKTQIPATHLPNQTHLLSSSAWEAKPTPPTIFLPFVLLTPSPLSVHHATSLPFVLRLPRSSHKSQRRMKGKKPAC